MVIGLFRTTWESSLSTREISPLRYELQIFVLGLSFVLWLCSRWYLPCRIFFKCLHSQIVGSFLLASGISVFLWKVFFIVQLFKKTPNFLLARICFHFLLWNVWSVSNLSWCEAWFQLHCFLDGYPLPNATYGTSHLYPIYWNTTFFSCEVSWMHLDVFPVCSILVIILNIYH